MIETKIFKHKHFHYGTVEFWYIPDSDKGKPTYSTIFSDYYLHREDGPAVSWFDMGEYRYYLNNKITRYDGPAITYLVADPYGGSGPVHRESWYIHSNKINKVEYLEWLDEMGMDVHNLSIEDKTIIDLKWGN